ncbi:transposase [Cytobacillus firmus]|nr:transposase [Cytobacillus firmus]
MAATEKQYKTNQILIKKGHRMFNYFEQSSANAKNLFNTTNFYIRQVYTALKSDKELQPLQREVLENIQKHLPKMNDVQLAAYLRKAEKEKSKPKEKRKELKCNLFEGPTKEKPFVDYNFFDALFKSMVQNDYRSLPTQSAQAVMKNVFQNWKSFFSSLKDYKKNPKKYKGRPRIPNYSRANQKEVVFSNQDCVVKEQRFLKFPKTKQRLNIGKLGLTEGKLKQVRVIPRHGQYVVEVIMETQRKSELKADNNKYMSIDLGIDNLATIITNTGHRPVLLKGRNIKSINQYYNKKRAHLYGILRKGKGPKEGSFSSNALTHLYQKRQRKVKDLFHKASRNIVNLAVQEDVSTIVIGLNKQWKQETSMSKKNNQSFTSIPHGMLLNMVEYKAVEYGITVEICEESYTSKASFLDNDVFPAYGVKTKEKQVFSGKRIKRGLYRSSNGTLLNADVNGACNILRKAFPNVFANGIEGLDGNQSINVSTPLSLIVR